jgi:DNA-3-methyladenine glycosylase II
MKKWMVLLKKVNIKGPYDFDRALDRLSLDPLHAVNRVERSIKVPLIINHKPQVAEIKALGTTESPKFSIKGTNELGIKIISDIFQWNVDLLEIFNHFQKTSLDSLFLEHYATPLVLEFNPYNCLVKSIIHQQLNLTFAHKLTERFVKTFGFEKEGVWFYPSPERTAKIAISELRDLQFSTRKAEYVIGVAEKIVQGEVDFDRIRQLSDEEIMDMLTKIRGVGPWTAQNLLMFGLGRQNLFPPTDIGIQNALKKIYHLDTKPTKVEIEKLTKGWEPYLSYASLYLWRSIE